MANRSKKDIALILLCILMFGGLGIYFVFVSGNTNRFDSRTEAYRIEENEQSDSDGDVVYYPIYYYRVKGENYLCKAKSGSSVVPNENKNIVYYDSKNPENCLTQYEKSTGKFAGIICIIVAIVVAVLAFRKPSKKEKTLESSPVESNQNYHIDSEKQKEMEVVAEKAQVAIEKVSLIMKRITLGIIILVLSLFTLFDFLIFQQTMKAKNYVETTATYVEQKEESDSEVFNDYIYSFEDKKGEKQEIIVSYGKDEYAEEEIKIKYDEKNPQEFYTEGQTLDRNGMIWFVAKVVIIVLLVILFFNKNLLNKIHMSVGN